MNEYDVVVIGSGPGGEGAAMQATKLGKSVAVIERHTRIGGGCTHWGTIPSKALRHAIFAISDAQNMVLRNVGIQFKPTFAQLRKSAENVISRQVDMRGGFYARNDVPLFSVLHSSVTTLAHDSFA